MSKNTTDAHCGGNSSTCGDGEYALQRIVFHAVLTVKHSQYFLRHELLRQWQPVRWPLLCDTGSAVTLGLVGILYIYI